MTHLPESSQQPGAVARPFPEITWQSVVGALVVSSLVAGSYPYVVLKLGMGPNVSVVSAFLGAVFLNFTASRTRGHNRLANNIIQTAGISAASTAFMCIVAAAFGYLDKNETVSVHIQISPWQMFTWLACSGMIGVVFTVLFRRYFLDDPKMIFADGVAAAETIEVLDIEVKNSQEPVADHRQDGQRIRALGYSALASAIVEWLRDGMALLPTLYLSQPYRAGFEWSFLNLGSGLLVGLNVGLSMLLGTLVIAYGVGPWIIQSGIGHEIVQGQIAVQYWGECQRLVAIAVPQPDEKLFLTSHCSLLQDLQTHKYFPVVLLWAMWPATGLMVASAVMAVALKWRSIVDTFRTLHLVHGRKSEDMSLKSVVAWASALTIALAWIQQANFGMSIPQTIVAIVTSLPLMLVGIRVLGETNNGPISVMANALQALFAVFWPAHIGLNLIAAGMAGSTSAQSEGTMQDFKTGEIIGSTPRILTYVQLAAVPIGAAAVAIMYPLLVGRYGLGGDGLTAPTGIKLANMAVLLSRGFEALPRYALPVTIAAVVVGIAVALVREMLQAAWVGFIPSVAAFGFALILPGDLNLVIAAGGIAGWVWMNLSRPTYDRYAITIASGMIAGEALLGGFVLPALAAFGLTPR